MSLFFTADLHFMHNKPFIYEVRGFDNVYEMNKTIVNNWNAVVNHDDEVYVLGDLVMNDMAMGIYLISRLNGKIHIIRGNHDSDTKIERYKECPNVVEIVDAKYFRYNGQSFYLSHFPTFSSSWEYPKKLKHKHINLCGHIHTKDKFCDMNKGIIYHVEVDAHNMTPVSIDQILEDIYVYNTTRLLKEYEEVNNNV